MQENGQNNGFNRMGEVVSSIDFDAIGTALVATTNRVTKTVKALLAKPDSSGQIIVAPGARTRSIGFTVGGATLLLIALGFAVTAGFAVLISARAVLAFGIVAACFGGGGAALVAYGQDWRLLMQLIRQMGQIVEARTSIALNELSNRLGIPLPTLRKRLTKAIQRGFIPQGHVAEFEGGEVLLLTNEAYKTYELEKARCEAMAQAQSAEKQAQEQADAHLPENARSVISACEDFIQRSQVASIQIANTWTRGTAVQLSEKVSIIMETVRKHPETASQLRRLANYYLPTTAKLLEAYAELDEAGAVGETADKTRCEVDDTLKLVLVAAEKLSGELLIDQSWDVASDASVMRTMLAQDGLADSKQLKH